jgi:hypothetical protein
VLKNILGWLLILASFVAGPLVPGPGGIPLFLIGFALISFPGKRRLTARVLRGKPVRFRSGQFALLSFALALIVPAIALAGVRIFARGRAGLAARGPLAVLLLYLLGAAITWCVVRATPHGLNVFLRIVARARRTFRPWLRHHRIRLLPPRWRRRHPHEPGHGPFRLADEIIGFRRRKRHE